MKTFTGQSPETVDFLSQKAYDYLEEAMESWLKVSHWSRMYHNGERLGKEYIKENFDLVVEDITDDVVKVYLQSKDNKEYIAFAAVVHKEFGEV